MQTDAFVRFDDPVDRQELLPVLYTIYSIESRKVSGSHGGFRKFSECLWTYKEIEEELCSKLAINEEVAQRRFHRLVGLLTSNDNRLLLKFEKDGSTTYVTRLAELVRTSGNLHEFQNRENQEDGTEQKFSIIEGTQWYPILRYSMPRDLTKEDLLRRLQVKIDGMVTISSNSGGHQITEVLEDLDLVLDAVASMPKYSSGNGLKYSEFQVRAIVEALMQAWTDTAGDGLVVTADTGMGKTLAFAIPTLVAAVSSLRNERRTMSQLLLYPRNALAKDQFGELENMVKYVNKSLLEMGRDCIGIAIDAEGLIKRTIERYPTPAGGGPEWGVGASTVFDASAQKYGGVKPASIVLASIESFRRRLRNPKVVQGLSHGLNRIVFDEVHLSAGIQGGHHHYLVGRLKQLLYNFDPEKNRKKALRIVGVSATIAKPRQHLNKIWGGDLTKIRHVEGMTTSDGAPIGMMHHVMYKPRIGTPMVGALVDITSSVLHQRRPRTFERAESFKKLQKSIGFADSHQIVGDWHSFMLPNESTEATANNRRTVGATTNLRRPYAHWHSTPLSIHEGGQEVCTSCQSGTYHTKAIELNGAQLQLVKTQTGQTAVDANRWNYNGLVEPEGIFSIKGLDTCTYLEMGKCWWFSPRNEAMEPRPGDPGYESFQQTIRTKRFTSITKRGESEDKTDGDMSANKVFAGPPKYSSYPNTSYKPDASQNLPIPHDLVIATPTLEVGVDMDNVSEVITHKAIRNISSYRQKVGRAGREAGSDALAVTLASRRASDFGHYRSMNRLVRDKITEPVPVATNNKTILKHHAYEAVFDFIAKQGIDVESITKARYPRDGNASEIETWDSVNQPYNKAIEAVEQNRCLVYMSNAVPETRDDAELQKEARSAVLRQLKIMLEPFPNLQPKEATYAQWIAHFKKQRHRLTGTQNNTTEWEDLDRIFVNSNRYPIDHHDGARRELVEGYLASLQNAIEQRDVDCCRTLAARIDEDFPQDDTFRFFRLYIDLLKDSDPIPPIARELDALGRFDVWYFSMIQERVDTFLQDRPYITLPSYFTNPHEEPVSIHVALMGDSRFVERVTSREALRYLQPGMFTHRVGYGNRMFINHSKNLEAEEDTNLKFSYRLDEAEGIKFQDIGTLTETETRSISNLLDVDIPEEMHMKSLKSLTVSSLNGANMGRNFVTISNDETSLGLLSGYDLEFGGPASPKILPKAHSINWILSDFQHTDEVHSYKVLDYDNGHPQTVPGVRHPIISRLFSSVAYAESATITGLGLGVSRSNMVTIQPKYNDQYIAYADRFDSNGLRFTISPSIMEKALNKSRDGEVKFSSQTMDMIAYWIRTRKDQFGEISSYTIDAYLDVLVANAWSQKNDEIESEEFPTTEEQFFKLLFDSGNPTDPETLTRRASLSSITNDNMNTNILVELQELDAKIADASTLIENLEDIRYEWYKTTLVNTLGVLLGECVAEFAGVQGNTVAYTTNFLDDGTTWCIDVFDNEPEGNGSCALVKEYFHIPAEIRHAAHYYDDKYLPSESFVEVLERKLMVCTEHLLHQSAIKNTLPDGLPAWFDRDHMELRRRFSAHWDDLSINSADHAVLQHMRRFMIHEPTDRAMQLDLELALRLCANGCPACNGDDMMNQLPPQLIRFGTNRGLLDEMIGDISSLQGYASLHTDSEQIHAALGVPVDGAPVIVLQRNAHDTMNVVRFIHNLGAGIGFNYQRHDEIPEVCDLIVRTKEVVE
jgi:hypothetical protein